MNNSTVQGVVMKVTEQYIVMIADDGTFKNVPRTSSDALPMIGQRYTYTPKKSVNPFWFKYASIASIVFLVMIAYAMNPFQMNNPAYIVALDINPSIEIMTDKNFKVIDSKGLNEDGKKLLNLIQTNDDLYLYLESIIEQSVEEGYLEHSEAEINATVVPFEDMKEMLVSNIDKAIHQTLTLNHAKAAVTVETASEDIYQEAKKEKLSVNHYKLYKDLKDNGIINSVNDINGMTVYELRQMESKKDIKDTEDAKDAKDAKDAITVPDVVNEKQKDTDTGKQANKKEPQSNERGKEGSQNNPGRSEGIPEQTERDTETDNKTVPTEKNTEKPGQTKNNTEQESVPKQTERNAEQADNNFEPTSNRAESSEYIPEQIEKKDPSEQNSSTTTDPSTSDQVKEEQQDLSQQESDVQETNEEESNIQTSTETDTSNEIVVPQPVESDIRS